MVVDRRDQEHASAEMSSTGLTPCSETSSAGGCRDPELERLSQLGVSCDTFGKVSTQDMNAKYRGAFSPLVAWVI